MAIVYSLLKLKLKRCFNNIVLSFVFSLKQPLKNLNNSFFDYEIDNIIRKNKENIINKNRLKRQTKNKENKHNQRWETEIIHNLEKL